MNNFLPIRRTVSELGRHLIIGGAKAEIMIGGAKADIIIGGAKAEGWSLAPNDTYSAAACRRVVFASVRVVGMERKLSAASETEEAAKDSESRPPSYTADEFLTGAGSKHAQIMRSAAIELLG
jgi:hypothetical protein